jgi:hypothetical protein
MTNHWEEIQEKTLDTLDHIIELQNILAVETVRPGNGTTRQWAVTRTAIKICVAEAERLVGIARPHLATASNSNEGA